MRMSFVRPEQWIDTPIVRNVNPLTGLIEGDDNGYRKVRTLRENPAPLVVPNVECRPFYDGIRENGQFDQSLVLPGGLKDRKLVVREKFGRDIENAQRFLTKEFGGEYSICALDGFRSWKRQAAGFSRLLREQMERRGVTVDNVDEQVAAFLEAGNTADGTVSWVNADVTSPLYAALVQELEGDVRFFTQLRDYAATQSGQLEDALDEAFYAYITISTNSDIGRAANRGIPLVFENNAHAGGGACDIFLMDRNGIVLNHIPFDYPGPEAGMDYLEDDANFEKFCAKAVTDEMIRNHLLALGLTPEKFSWNDWTRFRSAIRVLYHLAQAKGWTYYSSDHGGENWHLEGGNILYDALTGDPIDSEASAVAFPDSGNPGHALQRHGREAVAVWGGESGHMAAQKFGL